MKKLLLLLAVVAMILGIAGPVIAAEELVHTGRVVFVTSGDVEIAANEQADAVIVIDGDASIAGTVNTLVVVDGRATVSGATLETIAIVNGSAELDADTTVLGDVMQFASTVDRADGVEIGGSVRDMAGDVAAFAVFMGIAALAIWIGFGIATLIVGLLTAGLAARQVRTATALISGEPVTTALVGLLTLVVTPIVGVLAMVTVIGIPAGMGLLFVVWPAVSFIGYIVAAIWLGEYLLSRRDGARAADRPYAAATVGLLVAFVIGLVPIVSAILAIFGLGAVVLAAWRTLRGGPMPRTLTGSQPVAA